MHPIQYVLLVLSGLFAGIVNAVAGGGAIVIYPLLLSMGVAPINANATTTLTVWPGGLSSAYGYRKYIEKLPAYFYILLLPCLLGGILGAVLLKHTSNQTFEVIAPWFLIFSVVLLGFQNKIHHWLYDKHGRRANQTFKEVSFGLVAFGMFLLSIYGGYFGAGFGIVTLAFLGLTELSDIRQMNGLKNLTAISMNAVVVVYFVAYHLVDWKVLPFLLVGSVVGGLIGATYGSRLPAAFIRKLVIVIGSAASVILLINLYR